MMLLVKVNRIMAPIMKLHLGDIVQLKKTHPCGSDQWEVIRLGNDIKARCTGCGRVMMMRRSRFVRLIRKHIAPVEEQVSES